MLFFKIIAILGLTFIWSENPMIECNKQYKVNGCYRERTNEIVIGYKNPDYVLYHELAHALFLEDKEVKDLVKELPNLQTHSWEIYDTEAKQLNEKVADYFIEYRYFPESLKVNYPSIYYLFKNKIKIINLNSTSIENVSLILSNTKLQYR